MGMEISEPRLVIRLRRGIGNFSKILIIQFIAIGRVGSDAGSLIWDAISISRTVGLCMDGEIVKIVLELLESFTTFKLICTFGTQANAPEGELDSKPFRAFKNSY